MKIRQGIVSALVALALPLTLGVFPLSASAEEIGSTASPTQSAQGDANTGNTADAPTAGDGDSADQNNSAADFEGNDVGTDAGNGETSASDAPGSAPNASDATDAADSQDSADVADSADAAEAANSADANSSGSSNKAKANGRCPACRRFRRQAPEHRLQAIPPVVARFAEEPIHRRKTATPTHIRRSA